MADPLLSACDKFELTVAPLRTALARFVTRYYGERPPEGRGPAAVHDAWDNYDKLLRNPFRPTEPVPGVINVKRDYVLFDKWFVDRAGRCYSLNKFIEPSLSWLGFINPFTHAYAIISHIDGVAVPTVHQLVVCTAQHRFEVSKILDIGDVDDYLPYDILVNTVTPIFEQVNWF